MTVIQFMPYLLTSALGWVFGHIFAIADRHSRWLRLANYPIGIAGALVGTALCLSIPTLHNKLLLACIVASILALLLFQSLKRLMGAQEDVYSK